MDHGSNSSADISPHPFHGFDHVREGGTSPPQQASSPMMHTTEPSSSSNTISSSSTNTSTTPTSLTTNTNANVNANANASASASASSPATPTAHSSLSTRTSASTSVAPSTSVSSQGMAPSGRHHHTLPGSHHSSHVSLHAHHGSHNTQSPLSPPMPPLQTSTTSLASSAAARFSQAFSPLLSARRKSAAIDIPSTPDSHRSFSFALSSSVHASPGSGSLYASSEGKHHPSTSQEHLSSQAEGFYHQASSSTGSSSAGNNFSSSGYHPTHFESNFSKITSFSSPRSSNRSRKTHPGGIAHVPEESGYGSFATPPHTATAFHAGLASHFGMGSSSSQSREHHDAGHREGKGSIVGGGSSSIEKALKKAKVFLDEKAKPKARAASLWSFLDITFEFDQAKFFQEHADQVFSVTHDAFWHQIDKFKQKPDRNNALQSKEVIAVQKSLLLLRLIFLYLPDRMKNGWHRRPIANMLAQVLCHKNHSRIRIFGFRLLLLWINDQTVEYPEAIYLFSNAISLDLFMYDGEDLTIDHASSSQTRLPPPLMSTGSTGRKTSKQVSQYFELTYVNLNQELLLSDGPPICPNPLPPTFQDSIQLFQIFLGNIVRMAYVAAGSTPPPGELESINSHYPLEIDGETGDGIAVGFGIDAGLAAARFMFDIVKKYYLVKVFPECARNLRLIRDEGKEFGYKSCPPTILRTIISFIIQYCLDSNEFNSPQTHTSPATPILKSIVFASEVNREMMHEIVRQGLSLPPGHPQYKDIVRGAVHIVGVWCLSGEEERPAFLRSSSTSRSQMPSSLSLTSTDGQEATAPSQSGSQQTSPTEPYSTANSFLQRYFQLLTNVFAENPVALHDLGSNSSSDALGSTGNHVKLDSDALFHLYKDIIGLFRAILARGQIEMDTKSWEVLLRSLLEIQRRIIGLHEKLSSIMPVSSADELLSIIIETVLCAHSRCPNVSNEQWIALRKTITESLRFPQTVTQWAKWSVRLTNVLSHEVYQVDLEAQTARPAPASVTRHARKMSDKFRHSRFLTSKTDNTMRHSIGGELLSSQGVAYAHQTYPLSSLNLQERSSRRTNSVHYDPAKQGSGANTNANGTTMYAPTLLGHMGFLPTRELGRDHHSGAKVDVGEVDEEDPYDHVGSHISALTEALETSDEKLSRASSLSFHGPDSLHLDPIVERLSSLYGIFAAPDFVNVSMKFRSVENILSTWKNIICSIGNPNEIQIPLVKTEVMLCLIDIWDLLNQTRTSQSLNATLIPPLYDFAPWFFEAAKSSSDGGVGLPAIYGGLCRMMSRRYDQDFDPEYYQLFYASIIQLLKDGHLRDGVNHFIRKQAIAILCSVSMLFYDFAHERSEHDGMQDHDRPRGQDASEVDLLPHKLTFTRLALDLTLAEANVKPLGKFWDTHSMLIQLCGMLVVNEWSSSLATCDIGAESELLSLVLDHLYWTEASIVQNAAEVITTLAGLYQDHEDNGWIILEMVLSHLLSAMQEHLKMFQNDARRGAMIASFYRCLTEWLMVIPARIFSETELSKWVFELIEIGYLSAPDTTGENERKRALQAAKQQSHQQQHQPLRQLQQRKRGPSFKHTGKAIHQHHRIMVNTGPMVDTEAEQQAVKEAAEATLIHLVHFMNNVPSVHGLERTSATMGLDTSGKAEVSAGVGSATNSNSISKRDSGVETQRIFALNDSILITLEEIPPCGPTGLHRTRVIIRDETGCYAWDSEIFYREMLQAEDTSRPRSIQRSGSRLSERLGSSSRRRKREMASQLIWREGVKVRDDETHGMPRAGSSASFTSASRVPGPESSGSIGMESLLWESASSREDGDMLDRLLHYIGDQHPDCLFDGKTPLNQLNNGMALSTNMDNGTMGHLGSINNHGNHSSNNGYGGHRPSNSDSSVNKRSTIDFELDRHVQEENYYTRISDPQARAWYDKLVELRSSLIQSDDEIDEHQGSNTLMSLVVTSNWEAKGENGQPLEGPRERESAPLSHTALYNRAKRYSGHHLRHNNLNDIHANEAPIGPEQIPERTSSLTDEGEDRERELLGTGLLKEDASNMAKAFQLVLPPEPERPLDSYQHSRLLLSHLGFLCFDRFQEHNFVLLNQTASLKRDLKSLDKKSGRETFKIAILYVAAGQEGEKAILHNSKGSAAYSRFVGDLGWEVDLADHAGYMGGLEHNGSNGATAMYYCSSTLEVIFHEVVRMPTDPDDPRQVKKKRHVGNDHVHIVWSEHSRAYDRSTIGGDFGNVIIVLTPIPEMRIDQDGQLMVYRGSSLSDKNGTSQSKLQDGSDLVSIEVIRDTNLPVFGPLVDGMVVPMSQLGRLVRQTAIHAARLATAPPPLPPTPPSASFPSGTGNGSGNAGGSGAGAGAGSHTGNTGGEGGSGSNANILTAATVGTGLSGVGGGSRQMGHRGYYHSAPIPGSQISSAMQGHQYHLSNPAIHAGTSVAAQSSGSASGSVSGVSSGASGLSGGVPSYASHSTATGSSTMLAPMSTGATTGTGAAGGTSTLLTASLNSLANVGSGPNAASVSSLISNSGSGNDGISRNNNGSSTVAASVAGGSTVGAANGAIMMPGSTGSSTTGSTVAVSTLSSQQQQVHTQAQQQYPSQPSQSAGQSQQAPPGSTNASAPATVSSTFSASLMGMAHNVHPFKQRASTIEQIARRHKSYISNNES
ncbi:Ral GTPase-activating protein subunit alpha-2 [Mortierella claussenii]|nr:Ral GTPase-activating protein subunit alpha-2 [Mortierella claussenii]